MEKKPTVQDTANLEEKKYVQNHKEPPRLPLKVEGTYITSEHSYQKPPSFGQDCKSLADPGSSDDDDVSSFEEEQEFHTGDKHHSQYSAKERGMPEKVKLVHLSLYGYGDGITKENFIKHRVPRFCLCFKFMITLLVYRKALSI